MSRNRCLTCGHEPVTAADRFQLRQDLATVWLHADPDHPDSAVVERRHCTACQPDQHQSLACPVCHGVGPTLADAFADPPTVARAPTDLGGGLAHQHGWHQQPGVGLVCAAHANPA